MPFKHGADCRRHITQARYRITEWPAYKVGLRRRGDLTLWLDEGTLVDWTAPMRSTQTSSGGTPMIWRLNSC